MNFIDKILLKVFIRIIFKFLGRQMFCSFFTDFFRAAHKRYKNPRLCIIEIFRLLQKREKICLQQVTEGNGAHLERTVVVYLLEMKAAAFIS